MKHNTFAALSRAIIACERCPRLRRHCERIAREKKREYRDQKYWGKPVPGFGDPDARLLIVGLAPGAHGSNRTGRMFTGDASGVWLYEALHRFGFANQPSATSRDDRLALRDCYITAAARCAPPGNKPTPRELMRCRPYLQAELSLLKQVRVVLALGRVGHDAYVKATSGKREKGNGKGKTIRLPGFAHGAEARLRDGTILLSSYHPSRQNTNTRKLTREMWHGIFARARQLLDGEKGNGKGET